MNDTATVITAENTDLVKVNMTGLEPSESEEIKLSYTPYFIKIAEIKEAAKKINFENPTTLDERIARDLRLATVKIRTGSKAVKDQRKKAYTLRANVEQSTYNLIEDSCLLEENKFADIEKAQERREKAAREALKIERELLLTPYGFDFSGVDMGSISQDSFDLLINGLKKKKADAEIEAKRVEEERVKKEAQEKALQGITTQLMNLGAKNINDELIFSGNKIDGTENIVRIKLGALRNLDVADIELVVVGFELAAEDNGLYLAKLKEEKSKIEIENLRLQKEATEKEEKQKRYNSRIAVLTAQNVLFSETSVTITNGVKNETIALTLDGVRELDEAAFQESLKRISNANWANQEQLKESAEARKKEELREKAKEAKEKRYTERMQKMFVTGAGINVNKFVLRNTLSSENDMEVLVNTVKDATEEEFTVILDKFQNVGINNLKQLDLEKEALKADQAQINMQREIDSQKEVDRIAEEKTASNATDKDKILKYSATLSLVLVPDVKSEEAKKILSDVSTLMERVASFIENKCKSL